MPERLVYLDHNATTPVRPEVLEAMLPHFKSEFGNPNSAYFLGQKARKAVEQAREQVAAFLGAADPQEIVFTSCGSESDVMAIAGAAWAVCDQTGQKKRRLLSSRVEHDAVRGILGQLKVRGFSVDLAGVDSACLIDPAQAASMIGEDTALVSIMHANNEVGTVQPIEELAALCRDRGVLFHCDAVQSAGKIPLDVKKIGLDLLSISGHKLNAPKGVGALYVRKGVRLAPTITGHQEKNRRGGTENVAGIVGLGVACALAGKDLAAGEGHHEKMRAKLVEGVGKIADSRVNGHPAKRLPNCAHISFKGLEGHNLVVALDQEGICVSSGPACSTGSPEASHVLLAMGLAPEWAQGSIRVSMGWSNTEGDVDLLLSALTKAVSNLRHLSFKP